MQSETLTQGFNTAAHDSNPGSLSRESEAIALYEKWREEEGDK